MTEEDLEGRLAALELLMARSVKAEMSSYFATAWPEHALAETQMSVTELSGSLSGAALAAAERTLKRVFERAKHPVHARRTLR
jgi:hypothetical protein